MKNIKYVQEWRKRHKESPPTLYPVFPVIVHGQSCFIPTPTRFFRVASIHHFEANPRHNLISNGYIFVCISEIQGPLKT